MGTRPAHAAQAVAASCGLDLRPVSRALDGAQSPELFRPCL